MINTNESLITNRLPMTAVLISLNEEDNIAKAIKSVQFVNEVVVLDSGSTDRTREVATNLGAKVFETKWLGFGPTKKLAVSKASHDWILSLDCDEIVSDSLREEIKRSFLNLDSSSAYRIPRISFYLQKWVRRGGWYPDFQTRLFNRTTANWDDALIHEKILAPNILELKSPIKHYVFKNIEHQVQTNNKYSTLQAQEMFVAKRKFNWFHFFTKPLVKFVECYILKLGFLDGWCGFIIAKNASVSVFLKWAKLKELYDNQR